MKILKRGTKSSCKFKVIKDNFMLGGCRPEIGEILEFIGEANLSEALGLIQKGSILPDDLPPIGKYIVISSFYLPGAKEKFEAKSGDLVELKDVDALPLMLKGKVVPKDSNQWTPYRIRKRKILDVPSWGKDGK